MQDIGFEVASASSQKEAWLQKEAACRLPNVKVHSKVKGNLIASILEVAYYGITSWSSSEFYTDLCIPRASQVPGQPAWQTVAQRKFDGPGKLGNRVSPCFGRIRVQAFPLSL